MKKSIIVGTLVIAGFMLLAMMPANLVHASTSGGHIVENYVVVPQSSSYDYKRIAWNSIGEARGYVFRGINGAGGSRVVFVELVRHNSNWRIDSNGYKQYIMAWNGETVQYCNDYGTFSPYPRNGGTGYNNFPYDIHNGIGFGEGAYVDVSTAMKYDNWYMYQGNSGNSHWIYHEYKGGEESNWDGASMGGAFYFGNSNHKIEVTLITWKVVSGWWPFEDHKDMLGGQLVTVYLTTS